MSEFQLPFFERVAAQWEKVCASCVINRRDIALTDCVIRLHFAASQPLDSFWPALSHLEVSADTPSASPANQIDIFIWDTKESSIPLPKADSNLQLGSQGQILNLPAPLHATFNLDSGVLIAYDPEKRQAFVALRDADSLPPYEKAAPLRLLFGWIGEHHDFVATHAAAVAWNQGAVLLVGRGGSGKSTTSLACFLEGFDFLGDDYVAVTVESESKDGQKRLPSAHSLYRSAKVNSRSLELHPHLRRSIAIEPRPNTDDKYVLWADQLTGENNEKSGSSLLKSLPLCAIILPRVTGVKSQISSATSAQALAALAPSSIFQLAGASPATLSRLHRLTSRLPAFHLDLAPDELAPNLIKHVIEKLQNKLPSGDVLT